jgi:hypothetical protein
LARTGTRQPRDRRRVPRISPGTLRKDVIELARLLNERAEIIDQLRRDLDALRHDSELQFKRTAQIQVELDRLKTRIR